jgi:DNA-binding transcriptional ArsR family regulator
LKNKTSNLPDPKGRLKALETVFSALAHPVRRQIMLIVHFRGGEMTAGDIAKRFGHSWPTTTGHLRILEEAGLLIQEKIGRTRIYRLDVKKLSLIEEWMAWFKKPANVKRSNHELAGQTKRSNKKERREDPQIRDVISRDA